MNNADYNLYKIFIYLYEQKSISKVARLLYISQPAISYNLKELEKQLGYTLFYRNARGIKPTLEAKALYSYISKAFNIIRNGEEHVKNLNNPNIGCIKIGTPSHIGTFFLSSFIINFRKMYPGVKFELISKSTADMIEMLETREINLMIDTMPLMSNNKTIKRIALSKLQNCFVYNKLMFPKWNISKINDLTQYPLILPNSTAPIRIKLDEFMETQNIKLSPVFESWTTEMMLEMVKKGMGIGYFIKNVIEIQDDKDNFEVITFDNSLPSDDVCAVYIEEFVPAATKKFVDFLITNR